MKMILCGFKIQENYLVLVKSFMEIFILKPIWQDIVRYVMLLDGVK